MWKVASGEGNPFFKNDGGARRTFQGVKFFELVLLRVRKPKMTAAGAVAVPLRASKVIAFE